MWAVNGIYGGEEDNVFYRRSPDGLMKSGGRRLRTAESAMLGRDAIHAVTNPRPRACTGSIHIYGGDFVNEPRSQWDPASLEERPYDLAATMEEFAAANRAWLGAN